MDVSPHPLIASIALDNSAGARLARRLGFVETEHRRMSGETIWHWPSERFFAARHEAAHAIVALALSAEILEVSLGERPLDGGGDGMVAQGQTVTADLAALQAVLEGRRPLDANETALLRRHLAIVSAGMVAENHSWQLRDDDPAEHLPERSDLEQARRFAARLAGALLTPIDTTNLDDVLAQAAMDAGMAQAEQLLDAHRDGWDRITLALLAGHRLAGSDVLRFLT
jgi:hypothetical protein